MRITRVAQASIFEIYSKHEFGQQLRSLSDLLDEHPEILCILEADLINDGVKMTGRTGLSIESIFRCLILKQQLGLSYEQLAFHLSDSMTYRTFARLPNHLFPSRSALQASIRSVTPETLEKIQNLLFEKWITEGELNCEKLRIDSTVINSNIAPPSDSQLLCDGIRVLSRLLMKSKSTTGVNIRFHDQRKRSKSLGFRIFNGKNDQKEALYPELLHVANIAVDQAERGLEQVVLNGTRNASQQKWLAKVDHYRELLLKVISQTERRIINKEKVPASEKIVSLFEPHTDIIIKGRRDIEYGHKVNLSTQENGFVTYFSVEQGNPSDKDLFLPVVDFHQSVLNLTPKSIVADGGYASRANAEKGRDQGVQHVAFTKTVGLSLHEMGLKRKTYEALRRFRAGVEGNISELKRAFGAAKATWKGFAGFKAYSWASVVCYNLVRMTRLRMT